MKENNIYIYTLSDPRTDDVRYVGKTNNTKNRLKLHLQNKKGSYSYVNNWIKHLKSNKLKPILEIVDVVSEEEWEFWETYWISQFKTWGFNLTNRTSGGVNHRITIPYGPTRTEKIKQTLFSRDKLFPHALSKEQVMYVRQRIKEKVKLVQIARELNTNVQRISQIKNGRTYNFIV